MSSRSGHGPSTEPESEDGESSYSSSARHRRADSAASTSKPPSRPTSRLSRKRADSSSTAGGKEYRDKEEKKPDKVSRRLSVAGWASNAVGSVTGRSKKDKDKFATLRDGENSPPESEDDDDPGWKPQLKKSPSMHSTTKRSSSKSKTNSQGSAGILKHSAPSSKKVVRAMFEFSGVSDELSFKPGDEIVVLNEVLDGWWMGELRGRKGLFPTSYTEVIPAPPPLPPRSDKNVRGRPSSRSFGDEAAHQDSADDDYALSDLDERPVEPATHISPFFGVRDDIESIASTATDDEEQEVRRLVPPRQSPYFSPDDDQGYFSQNRIKTQTIPPSISRRTTISDVGSSNSTKKAPPPPPPRRSTNGLLPSSSPVVPDRRPSQSSHSSQSSSSGSLPILKYSGSSSSVSVGGSHPAANSTRYDTSPFESATELAAGDCGEFKQNPFKAEGMCSNCFRFHT